MVRSHTAPDDRSRSIARNTAISLVGQALPLGVAVVTMPHLIHGLGTERFGILTLAWMVIGYLSLFDLGLGRALTQLISERLGRNEHDGLAAIVWTALGMIFCVGITGTFICAALSPWLAQEAFKIPTALQRETLIAFYLLSASIPLVVVSAGLVGILTAHHRFDMINAVRAPLGIMSFALPALIISFSTSVVPITMMLIAARLIATIVQFAMCLRIMPRLRDEFSFSASAAHRLLGFGGWMTVSNIISPMMVYMDRFLIGVVVSISAVAYYATPYEVVTKLLIIPGALVTVLFPAFSSAWANDHPRLLRQLDASFKSIHVSLYLPVLLFVAFAPEILTLWLGADFSTHSSVVMQWLSIGVFINSFAQIPFALVQGIGRPDLTAKFHCAELAVYLPLLLYCTATWGVVGAAMAWTLRVGADGLLLCWTTRRLLPLAVRTTNSLLIVVTASCISLIGVALLSPSLSARITISLLLIAAFFYFTWSYSIFPDQLKKGFLKKQTHI